ncbi:tetratricopeptide repeat protein 14 isoform X4 [Osmerus eperlanus]|uniref:tetratricopeptide repeat protein 14 isoform X4 n=1 Tax=Osmerus eperlanus TaxID=29151 RepID=UPI002E167698
MDRDLLRQSLAYHGQSLYAHLSCEQSENPDFKDVAPDLSKVSYERKDGGVGSHMVEQFIARKADILFAPSWRSAAPVEVELDEEAEEPYAIMPPLELFMEVSYEDRRNMFYRDVERGDAVIGRINNIRDFGFFLTLICMGGGLERDIEDLELSALCPTRDVPSNGNHDDPLSYYQIGDLIRAGVKDIDRYHEKVTISLQPSSLSCSLSRLKLGVISRDDLPLHYTRSLRVANDSTETYERVMRSSLGYSNPSIVQFLLGKVGVSDTRPPSVMRGLQSKHFLEEDFAISLRKKQSSSWALKCVRSGVDHFKHNRHVEAMNEYNKALEIDTNNTEALVARGALYANKGSLVKAISDFELALESCPTHRNAKKYLCQTLVERGGQLEEQEKLVTAEGLYRRALALDSTFPDAQEAMTKIQLLIQVSWAKHTPHLPSHLTQRTHTSPTLSPDPENTHLTWPREHTPHLPSHLAQRTHTSPTLSPDPENTHLTYPLTWPREHTPHLPFHLTQRTHTSPTLSPDPENTHLTWPREHTPHLPSHLAQRTHTSPTLSPDPENTHQLSHILPPQVL